MKQIKRIKDFILRNVFMGIVSLFSIALYYFADFYNWENPTLIFEIHAVGKNFNFGVTNKDSTFVFLTAVIFFFSIIEALWREIERHKFKDLSDKNISLQAESDEIIQRLMAYFNPIIRDHLQSLYEDLEFNGTERITAYKVESDYFWPIGRVSENHEFREYRRHQYPNNQGCINIAWKKGEIDCNRMPKDEEKWCTWQANKWDIPAEDAKKIRMKSRSLYAKRIDEQKNSRKALVVLVFESTRAQTINKLKCKKIKDLLEKKVVELELMFLDYHEYGPSSKISEEGY